MCVGMSLEREIEDRLDACSLMMLLLLTCLANVAPLLMMGSPPPEQLPFLFNTAASPKFAAQLKSYGSLETI